MSQVSQKIPQNSFKPKITIDTKSPQQAPIQTLDIKSIISQPEGQILQPYQQAPLPARLAFMTNYNHLSQQIRDKIFYSNEIYDFINDFNRANIDKISLKLHGSFDYASYTPNGFARSLWDYNRDFIDIRIDINSIHFKNELVYNIVKEVNEQIANHMRRQLLACIDNHPRQFAFTPIVPAAHAYLYSDMVPIFKYTSFHTDWSAPNWKIPETLDELFSDQRTLSVSGKNFNSIRNLIIYIQNNGLMLKEPANFYEYESFKSFNGSMAAIFDVIAIETQKNLRLISHNENSIKHILDAKDQAIRLLQQRLDNVNFSKEFQQQLKEKDEKITSLIVECGRLQYMLYNPKNNTPNVNSKNQNLRQQTYTKYKHNKELDSKINK